MDQETRETLLRHYAGPLANVSTEQDAISVLAMAVNHIHSVTWSEYEDTAKLLLDGVFDVSCDSTRAKIVRAFDRETLKPCIIKFSSEAEVNKEAEVYNSLRDSNLNFVPNEVVAINHRKRSAKGTIDKSIGLKMPVFVSSLAALPNHVREDVVHTRVANDIFPALSHMHTLKIFHMDVKRENIMLDVHGSWFLGDFGSCASKAKDKYDITVSKKPFDLPHRPPSAHYDMVLLAVVCMDLAVGFLSKHSTFSMAELQRAVDELKNVDFKAFVRSLFD